MWQELKLEEHGFCGCYKEGGINADKAMICMSGSDGNKDVAISTADIFIEEGYSVLVLGFFKWEGMPKEVMPLVACCGMRRQERRYLICLRRRKNILRSVRRRELTVCVRLRNF